MTNVERSVDAARDACARARAFALAVLAAGIAAACGPELTTPGSTNVTGRWFSYDTAAQVTNFELELAQASDGVISGSWTGKGVELNGACPTELGCSPSNTVTGSNTVFQVHMDLRGAGAFTGQVEDEARVRGHLAGAPITFRRVGSIDGARAARGVP